MHSIKKMIIILIAGILIYGCGKSEDRVLEPKPSDSITDDNTQVTNNQTQPQKPPANNKQSKEAIIIIKPIYPQGSDPASVTNMKLLVSAPDIQYSSFELDNSGKGKNGEIKVTSGTNRLFNITAYSNDDIKFAGEKLVESITGGEQITVELKLEAVELAISCVPSEIQVKQKEIFDVDIFVSQVKMLYGCYFNLEFDTKMLEAVEGSRGNFLGNEVLSIFHIDPGLLCVGITRIGKAEGVNGSGTVTKAKFKAIKPGRTEIKIILVGKSPLCKNDGKKVDGLDKIYIKNMNVLIK